MAFTLPYATGSQKIEKALPTLLRLAKEGKLSELDDEEILEDFEEAMASSAIPEHLQVAAIPQAPVLGKGVFLKPDCERIDTLEFIGIYSGEYKLLSDEASFDGTYTFEVLSISYTSKKNREALDRLGFSFPDTADEISLYIDASKKGNFARYINGCAKPNVEAIIERVRGRPQVIYRALKKIKPGEQLLVDYTDSYWKPLNIKPLTITPATYQLSTGGDVIEKRA